MREVVNRWRVDDDWWRVPISRMYWVVATPTMLVDIFEDLRTGDRSIRVSRVRIAGLATLVAPALLLATQAGVHLSEHAGDLLP